MARNRIVVSDFVAKIGARIRFLRFEQGLSMRKLAELAGCSAESILQFELGRTAMTTRTMRKLARALHVQPFDILNHDTQTDDVGYVVETMRHDASVARVVLATHARGRRSRARTARDA